MVDNTLGGAEYIAKLYSRIPNPGSPDAIKAGCACLRFKNLYGWGIWVGGKVQARCFYTHGSCPIHCNMDWEEVGD